MRAAVFNGFCRPTVFYKFGENSAQKNTFVAGFFFWSNLRNLTPQGVFARINAKTLLRFPGRIKTGKRRRD
jgi:hypothetical protein